MQYIQHCCLAAVQSDVDGAKHNQNISNPQIREALLKKMAGCAVISANTRAWINEVFRWRCL
jgi:hypothetical protein